MHQVAAGGNRSIRVVIVDDSAVLVDTLLAALDRHPVLQVVGTATDAAGAVAAVAAAGPDVVLMDLRLGGSCGIDLLPAIVAGTHPPGVVVFSATSDERTREAVRLAGATAHLDKGAPLDVLFDTLVAAAPSRTGTAPQS